MTFFFKFQKQPYAFGSPKPPQFLSTLSSSSTLMLAKYFKYGTIFFSYLMKLIFKHHVVVLLFNASCCMSLELEPKV